MTNGAGRFAVASQFKIIQRFFKKNSDGTYKYDVPSGDFDKEQIADHLCNLLNPKLTSFIFNIEQYDFYDDSMGFNDYLERFYVWGSTSFKLEDAIRFTVDANGNRSILNLAVAPLHDYQLEDGTYYKENFDLQSDDFTASIGNAFIKNNIDPSKIGRKVEIEFTQVPLAREPYTQDDFDAENNFITSSQIINPIEKLTLMKLGGDTLLNNL
ncbi:MAG: hypothetical protein AB7U85_05130 [Alphaproteobacteria bacterium]